MKAEITNFPFANSPRETKTFQERLSLKQNAIVKTRKLLTDALQKDPNFEEKFVGYKKFLFGLSKTGKFYYGYLARRIFMQIFLLGTGYHFYFEMDILAKLKMR